MAYLPQIVAVGDCFSPFSAILSRGAAYAQLVPSPSIEIYNGGTGYTSGDVGKTVTLVPPTATEITPGTLVIASVSGGQITSFAPMLYTGYYANPGDDVFLPWDVTGATAGHGAKVSPFAFAPPVLISADAGLPTTFTTLTVSMWGQFPGTFLQSPLAWVSGGVTLRNATGTIFQGQSPNPAFADEHAFGHHLFSFDTVTKTILYYYNDVQQSLTTGTGWSATTNHLVDNGATYLWCFNSSWQPQAQGIASVYLATGFTDLTIEANRRPFINADGTSADPVLLPAAGTNMYLRQGDNPSALSSNYGGSGTWYFPNDGDVRFYAGWFGYLTVTEYRYNATAGVPFHGVLAGDNGSGAATQTVRPGAYLTYTLETPPINGSVELNPDGSFTYVGNNLAGDIFFYRATETMPAGYVQPFGRPLGRVTDSPTTATSGPFTATNEVLINVRLPVELKLDTLYPSQPPTDVYSFDSNDLANLPESFGQLSLAIWCCKSPTLSWAHGSIAMTPSQCTIIVRDNSDVVLFSGSFHNPGTPIFEYQVLFSLDTQAQTYSFYVNNTAWVASATFPATGDIGNASPSVWSLISLAQDSGVGDIWFDPTYVDFSNVTVRSKFIGGIATDPAWVYLGSNGELPTGTSPTNFLTVQPGNTPDDLLYGYGGNGGQDFWNLTVAGINPVTVTPYPDQMTFDDLCVSPVVPSTALTMDDLVVISQQVTSDNHVSLRWSDTRGASWASAVQQTLGERGRYDVDVSFRRLGMSRDRVWELSWATTSATALTGAFVQFELAAT